MAAIGLISFSDCNDSDGLACPPLSDMGIYWHHHWPTTVTRTCSHVASEKHWSQSTGYSSHSSDSSSANTAQFSSEKFLEGQRPNITGSCLASVGGRRNKSLTANTWTSQGQVKSQSLESVQRRHTQVGTVTQLAPRVLGMVITPVGWRWWLILMDLFLLFVDFLSFTSATFTTYILHAKSSNSLYGPTWST